MVTSCAISGFTNVKVATVEDVILLFRGDNIGNWVGDGFDEKLTGSGSSVAFEAETVAFGDLEETATRKVFREVNGGVKDCGHV